MKVKNNTAKMWKNNKLCWDSNWIIILQKRVSIKLVKTKCVKNYK